MRSFVLFFAVTTLAISVSTTTAQQKTVKWNNPDGAKAAGVTHKSYKSKSLDTEVGYCVYTPPGYATSKDRYPVVYFLHGAGGNENSDAAGFSGLVSKAIKDGVMPSALCVFPNGGMSGYADRPATKIMGETMIIKELIPLIDAEYRTIATREGRVLSGFSMGGGGAIRLAVKHPDLFAAAASWAGEVRAKDGSDEAVTFAEKNAGQLKGKTRLLFIVGDKDQTFAGHKPVVDKLKEVGVEPEMKVLEGVGHNLGAYHQQTGQELIAFLAKSLKQAK